MTKFIVGPRLVGTGNYQSLEHTHTYLPLGDAGAAEIAVVLRTSRVLTDLKLSNMNIGPEGVKALAAALRVNEVLTTLNLR